MNILLISKDWPGECNSGVSLTAALHAKILVDAGHIVSIMGSNSVPDKESLGVSNSICIPSAGSGALYSPVRINKNMMLLKFEELRPDLIIVEAWQTAITDTAIEIGHLLGINMIMISHGISVHPFDFSFKSLMRSLGWIIYKYFKLPRLVSHLNLITSLDMVSNSNRFYDRFLAIKLGIPAVPLVNCPVNYDSKFVGLFKENRKKQIIVVGYFSSIKNQLDAIRCLDELPLEINLKFVGPKKGSYYEKCKKLVNDLNLSARVIFLEDNECNISNEIATSLAVLSTSITEVLPLVLLEAMALGTPFVANDVGAIRSLGAGIIVRSNKERYQALMRLINDGFHWEELSKKGIDKCKQDFSFDLVKANLLNYVGMFS